MPYFKPNEMPEWVGVAIRWPDGRVDAYELRGRISATIEAEEEEDLDWYTRFDERFIRAPRRLFRATVEGTEMTWWRQGADAAPKERQREIEPERKAIGS